MDLNTTGNRGKSEDLRFINRVFTSDEEHLIRKALDKDGVLWAIWACKEAAYKAAVKCAPVPFIPRNFTLLLNDETSLEANDGRLWVNTPVGLFRVQLKRGRDFVHSLAFSADLVEEKVICRIWPLESEEDGKALRGKIIAFLSSHLRCPPGELEVRRSRSRQGLGPPVLYLRGKRVGVDMSISHDGSWGAFASLLDNT
ncbi:MAG TPA: 4'-phosphopantetheinyl transferase superfamily protein [Syntrophales bacterium]|nr:4'-phosphopantetheinyl transferase superfamily protein [Syntrophales bacterium]HOL58447.1 4'-phosphopantetheinyl transferase superfamily protein [Syntrophales bacterium]HPO34616.1 4'-phosphopantetheinyl transferase superfamily protein [Syntrophales bacterium]